MHPAFAALALPLVSTLGVIFILFVAARDREAAPLSLPMTILCGAIIALLATGIHDAPAETPWAWPATVLLCVGLIGCGLWDQRLSLFGGPGPDRGHVPASGLSLAGLALIAATEELLFRGLMQSSLVHSFSGPGGALAAIFLVNLAFAAIHLRHGLTFAMSAGFFRDDPVDDRGPVGIGVAGGRDPRGVERDDRGGAASRGTSASRGLKGLASPRLPLMLAYRRLAPTAANRCAPPGRAEYAWTHDGSDDDAWPLVACGQEAAKPVAVETPRTFPAGDYEISSEVIKLASSDRSAPATKLKQGDKQVVHACVARRRHARSGDVRRGRRHVHGRQHLWPVGPGIGAI